MDLLLSQCFKEAAPTDEYIVADPNYNLFFSKNAAEIFYGLKCLSSLYFGMKSLSCSLNIRMNDVLLRVATSPEVYSRSFSSLIFSSEYMLSMAAFRFSIVYSLSILFNSL